MKKLRNSIESLGLSFKKEIITLVIVDLVIVGLTTVAYFFLKNPIFLAFGVLAFTVITFLYLSRYKSISKSQIKDELNEFVSLLSFFKVYISNGYTVYQSLKELMNYTSGKLLDKIQKLIDEIDIDKSVTPFINFSSSFSSLQIEQLMICIYQMIDEGNNFQYITQFELLFDKLRTEMLKSELSMKEGGLSNMTVFPLLGSALLIVTITFGVVQVIGVTINGL